MKILSFQTITSLLIALLSIFLYYTVINYDGRPTGSIPPEAIPIYANTDLTIVNRIVEYLFPIIVPVGSMSKCPVLKPDEQCMLKGRNAVQNANDNAWPNVLKTHEETVMTIEREEDGQSPLEVVVLKPLNKTEDELGPLIVWFHGGGFTAGSARDSYLINVMKELNVTNAIWGSVEYRLAPEHPYPAASDDGFKAIQHLSQNTNLTKNGMHIAGVSAGATLSVLTAFRALQAGIDVDSIYSDNPVFTTSDNPQTAFDSPSYRRNYYTRISPVGWTNWVWNAYKGCDGCDRDVMGGTLSPEEWKVGDADLPSMVLLTAKGDVFRDGGLRIAEVYRAAGGRVKHVDASASHALTLMFDREATEKTFRAWREMIVG